MFKEFFLKDIAQLDNGNKFDKNKMTHNNPSINFVSRTANNNGISDFVDYNGTAPYKSGCITLAFGGSIGSTFLQTEPFYTGQNVGVITLPDFVTDEAKLYFCTVLAKICKAKYVAFGDEINKHFKTDLKITLPVTQAGEIDWQFMHERISELMHERISELDAYLKAAGLNDWELTDEDKNILAEEKIFKEFRIGDLFDKVNLKRIKKNFDKQKDISKEPSKEFYLPLVNAKFGDNGIMYYGRPEDWESDILCIDIVNDGAISTGKVYAQPQRTGVLYNAYLIKPIEKNISAEILLYLSTCIEKITKEIFSYDNKATWDKVKEVKITLPVTQTGEIDFEYMEKYIRAIEKKVIAGVVKYKDAVIEATKKIVEE